MPRPDTPADSIHQATPCPNSIMADKITQQRKLLRTRLDVGVNVREQGQLHGLMVNGESPMVPSCRMGAGGWGVMFQIKLGVGAEVCGGSGPSGHCIEGRQGEQSCCLIFRIWCLQRGRYPTAASARFRACELFDLRCQDGAVFDALKLDGMMIIASNYGNTFAPGVTDR